MWRPLGRDRRNLEGSQALPFRKKSDPSFSDSVIEEGKATPEASVPVLKLSMASK